MPRRKKSRRRKRIQRGGNLTEGEPGYDSKGGLKEPLINTPQSSSKTNKLKNIYEKGKKYLPKFTFEDMSLWVLFVVALVTYSISIAKSPSDKEENLMLVITYSILLACTLFIGIYHYLSKKGKDSDVTSSIMGIFKTTIPLLSSIAGLIYIIVTYSNNLKTISDIGKHVEELSIFNNFIAVMSFLQVSRLINYFKRMGGQKDSWQKLMDSSLNMFDYVIFTLCFIIQMALTIILSNKLESYRTDG